MRASNAYKHSSIHNLSENNSDKFSKTLKNLCCINKSKMRPQTVVLLLFVAASAYGKALDIASGRQEDLQVDEEDPMDVASSR